MEVNNVLVIGNLTVTVAKRWRLLFKRAEAFRLNCSELILFVSVERVPELRITLGVPAKMKPDHT